MRAGAILRSMNLQQLRIVRETARRRFNLTEVAAALYLAQSGVSKHIKDLEDFAQRPLEVGDVVRKGSLELCLIPFLLQPDYDRLLWACDLNFVRGEDSFVRAQWAARPFIWHIYPQPDGAHQAKLNAFLDLHLAETEPTLAISLRNAMRAWNGIEPFSALDWENLTTILPQWRQSAVSWQNRLMNQADLCAKLVQFCQSRL